MTITDLDFDLESWLDGTLEKPCGVRECRYISDFYGVGTSPCFSGPMGKFLCNLHKQAAGLGRAGCGKGCYRHTVTLTWLERTR